MTAPGFIVHPMFDASGTSLQGYVEGVTFDELVATFGQPARDDDGDDKVRVEWIIKFEGGTVATIYDWKETRPIETLTDWHVGGHGMDAVMLLASVLPGVRGAR